MTVKRNHKHGALPVLFGAIAVSCLMMADPSQTPFLGHADKATQSEESAVEKAIKQARALQKLGRWEDAFAILEAQAAQGHPLALYHLGRALKAGQGTTMDREAAKYAFKAAVAQEFSLRGETAYELGRLYQRAVGPGCLTMAYQWFMKSEEWGYAKADVQLAKHYERGLGVPVNLAQALTHYEKAAINGYPTATIQYARLLNAGHDEASSNPDMATYWFERAVEGLTEKANNGSPSAAKSLGRLYARGEFSEPDPVLAEQWFIRSAELGDAGAMHELGLMLIAETDPVRQQQGIAWLRHGADAKHGGAITDLGRLHLKQRFGFEASEAITLFERGVALGHPGSMEELGRLYLEGELVTRDVAKARSLAERGASMQHRGAQSLLDDINQAEQDLALAVVPTDQ